jgi:hypothetical protein
MKLNVMKQGLLLKIEFFLLTIVMVFGLLVSPLLAQVTAIDPDDVINAPANKVPNTTVPKMPPVPTTKPAPKVPAPKVSADDATLQSGDVMAEPDQAATPTAPSEGAPTEVSAIGTATDTFKKDDILTAAEGVFGKGAKGLAGIVEKILKDQGQPNAYIAGREASGAFVVGLRYGSGTLTHGIEGQRPVYWTGPSVGFDVGADATKTFVLVYNLYDTQDLYRRYAQVEGRAYYVGGFSATYLRRGNVALIPIRLGVGVRLGVNAGYMKFTEKSKILPF